MYTEESRSFQIERLVQELIRNKSKVADLLSINDTLLRDLVSLNADYRLLSELDEETLSRYIYMLVVKNDSQLKKGK